ncbi:hypothetical protein PACILC2_47790 [Paenibacillus cisolokensis]|uniref:Gfo/Idh/MocA-like oxidoreductase N-terminal domain-containing protein n=1 Tax=Paenibacillus cisolokensis TaxID=1658519 RepID=A0ABQ4NEA8_9BACL|nr:hypothetical protein PACILC2_47790 [Paenibacillus cisolokensis]
MKTLNVGMIGAGFMGKAHSLSFAAMPMFFWPAPAIPVRKMVADVTEEAAAEAAKRLGFELYTADWREVVEHPDIDVIDIVTPNNSHAEIAIAAAKAGKHIICEKPLARDAAEAKAMLDAVEAAGVKHMVAFNYRRTPAVALAKNISKKARSAKFSISAARICKTGPPIRIRRCPGASRKRSPAPARLATSARM